MGLIFLGENNHNHINIDDYMSEGKKYNNHKQIRKRLREETSDIPKMIKDMQQSLDHLVACNILEGKDDSDYQTLNDLISDVIDLHTAHIGLVERFKILENFTYFCDVRRQVIKRRRETE